MDALTENPWSKTHPELKLLDNPSMEDMRAFAKAEEITTEFGAPAYLTHHSSGLGAENLCFAVEGVKTGRLQQRMKAEPARAVVRGVRAAMPLVEWLSLDRCLGREDVRFHCRLLIPKAYSRVGLLWAKLLFPAEEALRDPQRGPDFLTICFPNIAECAPSGLGKAPARIILIQPEAGVTLVLGTDSAEAVRMSFLMQAMYRTKQFGGMAFHAGLKLVRVAKGEGFHDRGMLLVGRSGSGKTALAIDDHGFKPPEAVSVLQDDIVLVTPDGKAHGTEEGNRLYEFLKAHPDIEAYLLNTGSVGKGADAKGFGSNGAQILQDVSSKLLAFVARQEPGCSAGWARDPDWGYEVPKCVPGVTPWNMYEPRRYYTPAAYRRLTDQLREERRAWLGQFTRLPAAVRRAI
ncbi:MAG: phosphoenolpyruvate carboxykinase (ATP) [Elusimicrobia bacterium]|nr:phosphoenolpyruvate carboxykinase (ATP) [Elusimicrobiota bacterium]